MSTKIYTKTLTKPIDLFVPDMVNYIIDRQNIIKDRKVVERLLSMHLSRIYITTKSLKWNGVSKVNQTRARRLISSCHDFFLMNEIPVGYNEIKNRKRWPAVFEGREIVSNDSLKLDVVTRIESDLSLNHQVKLIEGIENSDELKLTSDGRIISYKKEGKISPVSHSNMVLKTTFSTRITFEKAYSVYCSVIYLYRFRWRKKYGILDFETFKSYLINDCNVRNYHVFNFLREITGLKYKEYRKEKIINMIEDLTELKDLNPNTFRFKHILSTNAYSKDLKREKRMRNLIAEVSKEIALLEKEVVNDKRHDKKYNKYKKAKENNRPSEFKFLEENHFRIVEKEKMLKSKKKRNVEKKRELDRMSDRVYSGYVEGLTYLSEIRIKKLRECGFLDELRNFSGVLKRVVSKRRNMFLKRKRYEENSRGEKRSNTESRETHFTEYEIKIIDAIKKEKSRESEMNKLEEDFDIMIDEKDRKKVFAIRKLTKKFLEKKDSDSFERLYKRLDSIGVYKEKLNSFSLLKTVNCRNSRLTDFILKKELGYEKISKYFKIDDNNKMIRDDSIEELMEAELSKVNRLASFEDNFV